MAILTTNKDPFGDSSLINAWSLNDTLDPYVGAVAMTNFSSTTVVANYVEGQFGNGINSPLDNGVNTNIIQVESSISVWFKYTASGYHVINDSHHDGANWDGFELSTDGAGLSYFYFNDSASGSIVIATPAQLNENGWNHVYLFTKSGRQFWVVNGVVTGTDSWVITNSGVKSLRTGYSARTLAYSNSYIDHLMLFNRELTLSEAVSLYEMRDFLLPDDTDPFADGSLVAGYKLDGDATDYVGTKDGTQTSMTYASSPLDQEAVFDGTNSEIDIEAYSETLVSSTLPFSISFFVTLNELKGQNLISFGGTSNGLTICQFNGLNFGFTGNQTSVVTQHDSGVSPSLSTRYHMVLARIGTGTTYNMFIDKVLLGSAVSVPFGDGGDNDRIGGSPSEMFGSTGVLDGARLNGRLDQVMFFNREVSQNEVNSLFEMAIESAGLAIMFNGVTTTQVFFNGTELTDAYFNGTQLQ